MIAIYLHDPRPEAFDRARGLVAALGDDTRLVSAHPPPLGWTQDWSLLPDSEPSTLAGWLDEHSPGTVILDGPAEIARVVRGAGARLIVVAAPGGGFHGERGCAYADASAILAPWPAAAGVEWPTAWRERTIHVGALGFRAAQVAREAVQLQPEGRAGGSFGHCIALWPTHAGPGPRERRTIALETAGWRWTYAPERDLLDPGPVWSALMRAEVAVCPPTPTTIAALAAFEVPAVLVLPERATTGQEFLAEAAAAAGPVVVARPSPQASAWPGLLEAARLLDGSLWKQWDPEPGLAELAGMVLGADGGAAADVGLVPA